MAKLELISAIAIVITFVLAILAATLCNHFDVTFAQRAAEAEAALIQVFAPIL